MPKKPADTGQLDLFEYGRENARDLPDRLRDGSGSALEGISPGPGGETGNPGQTPGSLNGSAGENQRGDGAFAETITATRADTSTSPRSSLGTSAREVHLSPARTSRLNARNYRIQPTDRVGEGSLKRKLRDNVA